MENKAVKVHVPSEIYETILEIQQNLRNEEGKKTSLAEIILRLTQKGLKNVENEQNQIHNTQNKNSFAQNKTDFVQNSYQNTQNNRKKNLFITSEASKNKQILKQRLKYLNEREGEIRELEAELFAERGGIIERERELLKNEEEFMEEKYNTKYNNIEKDVLKKVDKYIEPSTYKTDIFSPKILKNNNNEVKEALLNIQEELKSLKSENKHNEVIKYLEDIQKSEIKIYEFLTQPQAKTTLQQIEPYLPAISTALVSFLMNKKNEKNDNSDEILNEIKALMGNKNEEDE